MRGATLAALPLLTWAMGCTSYGDSRIPLCWDEDVPVLNADEVTWVGVTPQDVIDLVNDHPALEVNLTVDPDLPPAPDRQADIRLQVGAFVSAFQRTQYELPEYDLCHPGPVIAVDATATLQSDVLGPGSGTLKLWSRGADLHTIWVAGWLELDAPPEWLHDTQRDPAQPIYVRFQSGAAGVDGKETADPASSWASPWGSVGAHYVYAWQAAEHVEP